MFFKFDPQGFVPGFNVKQQDAVPGFNVWEEDFVPGFNVRAEDALANQLEASGVEDEPNVIPIAAGDLRCSVCGAGKQSGMTGSYRINGRVHYFNCAVKALGYEGTPSSELPRYLEPYELDRKGSPRRPLPRPPRIGR